MMKVKLYIFILTFSYCTNSRNENRDGQNDFNVKNLKQEDSLIKRDTSDSSIEVKIANKVEENNQFVDTVDYLLGCGELNIWVGGIQFSKAKNVLVLGSCFLGSESYDLAFTPVDSSIQDPQELMNLYRENNIKKDFHCFLFFVDKVRAKKPENEFHKYDYNFPMKVTAKKLINNQWIELEDREIRSFEDLGNFKYEVIYK